MSADFSLLAVSRFVCDRLFEELPLDTNALLNEETVHFSGAAADLVSLSGVDEDCFVVCVLKKEMSFHPDESCSE